jgi:hypothetical protein
LGWRRDIKDDECGKSKYEGKNVDDKDGIFRFEGEDEGERVWMVSVPDARPVDSDIPPVFGLPYLAMFTVWMLLR